jgi:hypothetical protein
MDLYPETITCWAVGSFWRDSGTLHALVEGRNDDTKDQVFQAHLVPPIERVIETIRDENNGSMHMR